MNNIKGLRIEKNLTQIELSRMAQISQPYLHDLENGNRGAKRETLERIAKALNVEVEDLTVNS